MKKVAIFGNTGGGKSTLAKRLAEITGLPLYPLDLIQFRSGGREVPNAEYRAAHDELLQREKWIIDGFGCVPSAWQRFEVADTLVYVDLPLPMHFWRVTKRLLKAPFVAPEGWPAGSPIWRSTLNSYKVIRLCHRDLAPRYRKLVADQASSKQVHHLTSDVTIRAFLDATEASAR